MSRLWCVLLIVTFPNIGILAQNLNSSTSEEQAYFVEIGVISYEHELSARAIREFQSELSNKGAIIPDRYSDLVSLAYQEKAKEISRVALRYVLQIGDVSQQELTTRDSKVFAHIRLLSSSDSSLKADITTQFSGRLVNNSGGGGSAGNTPNLEMPLDDKEHHIGGGGHFALFPQGNGQYSCTRRYFRARAALPQDFKRKKVNREAGLPFGFDARTKRPRFLALDEKWQWLKLISPSEYDDFASLEKLGEILDNKMIQESKRVV
ncbi:MAG: hypothetical protein KDB03_13670 [Planctomycetales bacterium]|nr:hypothetical protein [Planctomycetales bacterium]